MASLKLSADRYRKLVPSLVGRLVPPKAPRQRKLLAEALVESPVPPTFEQLACQMYFNGTPRGLPESLVPRALFLAARALYGTSSKVQEEAELHLTPAVEMDDAGDEQSACYFWHGDLVVKGELSVNEGAWLIVTGVIRTESLSGDEGLLIAARLSVSKKHATKKLEVIEMGQVEEP